MQADHRFRDNVKTLDQLGFQLEGMPSPAPRNPDIADNVDAVTVRALEDLTQVAPFLEAAVEGELRHERGRHFVHDYRRILDDPEHGFYLILCQLHRLRATVADSDDTNRLTSSDTNSSTPTAGGTVQSNAIRHYRDYVVLRDFGRLLDNYRHQLWHRRGRTSRGSRDASEV